MTTCIEAGHGKANTSDKNKHLSAIHECFEGVFNAVRGRYPFSLEGSLRCIRFESCLYGGLGGVQFSHRVFGRVYDERGKK